MQIKENELIDNYIYDAIAKIKFPPKEQGTEIRSLSISDMMLLATIAEKQAAIIGIDIVFSVVDKYGLQRFYFSMQNALLVSHTLATKKAYSAVALKMPTHQLAELIQPNRDLYGIDNTDGICGIGGGLPCLYDGCLIAGIGVSGGTVEEDISIATKTLQQFSQQRFPLYSTK